MDKQFAEFFKDQCIGSYTGHMANIKFNPVIAAIIEPLMQPHIVYGSVQGNNNAFAKTLREIADALETEIKPWPASP